MEQLQDLVHEANYDMRLLAREDLIIRIQAKWRGLIQRRKFLRRLAFLKVNERTFIRIQATWKGMYL